MSVLHGTCETGAYPTEFAEVGDGFARTVQNRPGVACGRVPGKDAIRRAGRGAEDVVLCSARGFLEGVGNRFEEQLGVAVLRVADHVERRALLDHFALVEHDHLV